MKLKNTNLSGRAVITLSCVAGLTDTMTGISLVFMPIWTLGLMGVDSNLYQVAMIRFIGGFVFGTGSLYLLASLSFGLTGKWGTLRTVWLITAWIRTCIALLTGWMIFSGELPGQWVSVPATDAILAVVQFAWIGLGGFPCDE